MITDPVNVRAGHPGATNYRLFRGAVVVCFYAGLQVEDAVGHQRDTEHPDAFPEYKGLRLSLSLPCNLAGSVVQ